MMIRYDSRKDIVEQLAKKAAALFTLLAQNFLVIVLLFIALNAAIVMVNKVHSLARRASSNIMHTSMDTIYTQLYPDFTLDQRRALSKETWSSNWEYEPWTQFREKPRRGTYVNISQEGFRYSQLQQVSLSDKGYKVFVFGGSNVFGYGVADTQTIAAYLQKRLKTIQSDAIVYNFGRGYYYSTQQLVLLQELLRKGYTPDMVISLDGPNENQLQPSYTQSLKELFRSRYHAAAFHWQGIVTLLPLSSLLKPPAPDYDYWKQQTPKDIALQYQKNRAMLDALGTQFEFTTRYCILPVPGYKNRYLNHHFVSEPYLVNFEKYSILYGLFDNECNDSTIISLTDCLQKYPIQPFVDACHYSAAVNKLLADAIVDKVFASDSNSN